MSYPPYIYVCVCVCVCVSLTPGVDHSGEEINASHLCNAKLF